MSINLLDRLGFTAFAFRGYNTTNLGRTPELLAHRVYGPVVERYLTEASEICADVVKQKVDLVARVRRNEETTVETYHEALALVVGVELAQIRLLEEFFDIRLNHARMIYGYSLGELTAVVAAGIFELQDALKLPLAVAAVPGRCTTSFPSASICARTPTAGRRFTPRSFGNAIFPIASAC